MALLPRPAPSQVSALAKVISNLFLGAPPAPAGPDRTGLAQRAGTRLPPLSRVVPRAPGCPACGSQEALHVPAVGTRRCAGYQAFSDLDGGATTTGPDATYPPATCRKSGGGRGGRSWGGVWPGVRGGGGGGSSRGSWGGLPGGSGGGF